VALSKESREELLRLFILKLDEEANYLDSPSPDEDLCECPKCQVNKRSFFGWGGVVFSALRAV
jgi:hypothetical protein